MQSWLNRDFDRENKKPHHPNTILEAFQVMNIVTGCNHLIGEGKSIPESFGSSPYVGISHYDFHRVEILLHCFAHFTSMKLQLLVISFWTSMSLRR